ncbi:MAG: peptide MFS transporter, partial [Bacteroidota bacterium]
WERFCYYGMRVLLTLYLVKSLMKGDAEASIIYGAYTALVYAAPVLGGRLADQFLGYRYAIILGAILMSIGEFMILGGNESWLLIGMGAIIVGNGYFKANISTIVGKLYEDGDPRRDSGFTIFYVGINVGAFLATTVVAYVGEEIGFQYGFGLAGIGMLLGLVIFYFGRDQYQDAQGLEFTEAGLKKVAGPLNMIQLITVGSLLLIPVCYFLISYNEVLTYMLSGLFIWVIYSLISSGAKEGSKWRDRMIALVIFMVINIVFWACFEQAGTSLTLFADRNVDRMIFGWEMPASMTQFFNPAFIIIFGSIFSVMWVRLSAMGKNPSIPMKFALGIFQLGLGFLVTYVGFQLQSEFLVPLMTLVILYLLHTTGELFLSPIGLSMVTKLAPKHIAGTAMGGWFLSFAIANFLGGQIAALTGAEGHGGEEATTEVFSTDVTVRDAAAEVNGVDFDTWESLDGEPRNITVQKYLDIRDWVEFRSVSAGTSFGDWQANRSMNTPFQSAEEWLNAGAWKSLSQAYAKLKQADEANPEQAGLDYDGWMYFRKGFDEFDQTNLALADAFSAHKDVVLKTGLEKYVNIFTIIGLVLVGFSLLIAVASKPLNRLMHGVV